MLDMLGKAWSLHHRSLSCPGYVPSLPDSMHTNVDTRQCMQPTAPDQLGSTYIDVSLQKQRTYGVAG